jgi:hypothetical protein
VSVDARGRMTCPSPRLASRGQGVKNAVVDQVDAVLAIKAADVGEDRLEVLPEPETIAQRLLDAVLGLERLRSVLHGNEPIDLRIPHIVVDTVEC